MTKTWNWKTTLIPAVGAAVIAFAKAMGASNDALIFLGSLVTLLTGWAAKDHDK